MLLNLLHFLSKDASREGVAAGAEAGAYRTVGGKEGHGEERGVKERSIHRLGGAEGVSGLDVYVLDVGLKPHPCAARVACVRAQGHHDHPVRTGRKVKGESGHLHCVLSQIEGGTTGRGAGGRGDTRSHDSSSAAWRNTFVYGPVGRSRRLGRSLVKHAIARHVVSEQSRHCPCLPYRHSERNPHCGSIWSSGYDCGSLVSQSIGQTGGIKGIKHKVPAVEQAVPRRIAAHPTHRYCGGVPKLQVCLHASKRSIISDRGLGRSLVV